MQAARDVGRRNHDAVGFAGGVGVCLKDLPLFPILLPFGFGDRSVVLAGQVGEGGSHDWRRIGSITLYNVTRILGFSVGLLGVGDWGWQSGVDDERDGDRLSRSGNRGNGAPAPVEACLWRGDVEGAIAWFEDWQYERVLLIAKVTCTRVGADGTQVIGESSSLSAATQLHRWDSSREAVCKT